MIIQFSKTLWMKLELHQHIQNPNSKCPSVVRPVAPLPYLFAHARHVARDAGVAADRILGVRGRDRHVLHQDVGRQAAAEKGGTGRATDAVGIVAIQLDTWKHLEASGNLSGSHVFTCFYGKYGKCCKSL